MSYTVAYKHAYNRTSEQWHGSLGEAQARAVSCVTSGTADYVEILDSSGKVVDCYPVAATQRRAL